MPELSQIDKNFQVGKVNDLPVNYFEVDRVPFVTEGFGWQHPRRKFYRLPSHYTEKEVNPGALFLAHHTAGGAIRFRSNSPYAVIRAELENYSDFSHMPRSAIGGFDCYIGTGAQAEFRAVAMPTAEQILPETPLHANPSQTMVDWMVNLPLYSGVKTLTIGLKPGSRLETPTPHAIPLPVAFYGSSITQGGCASRPGNAYSSLLCRAIDAPQINLGFSGSGCGEIAVAQAIASLELSALILDYDYNAPDAEFLADTHEIFFQTIRTAKPALPIIILSACSKVLADTAARRRIIRTTYEHAVASGDHLVWFIGGDTLFAGENIDACTVDICHPNDLGFYRMYQTILPVLKKAVYGPF